MLFARGTLSPERADLCVSWVGTLETTSVLHFGVVCSSRASSVTPEGFYGHEYLVVRCGESLVRKGKVLMLAHMVIHMCIVQCLSCWTLRALQRTSRHLQVHLCAWYWWCYGHLRGVSLGVASSLARGRSPQLGRKPRCVTVNPVALPEMLHTSLPFSYLNTVFCVSFLHTSTTSGGCAVNWSLMRSLWTSSSLDSEYLLSLREDMC